MRIGIDFDNTIVCYDSVFQNVAKTLNMVDASYSGNKIALREHLNSLAEGEFLWQKLQGKVYGEFMQEAQTFAGFKSFIHYCHINKIDIFIVSHKTIYGHFDEKKINLQQAATQWLASYNFFNIPKPNIFFETTRENKIARIKALACDYFIDDLIEIFQEDNFPVQVKQVLFDPHRHHANKVNIKCYATWEEIQDALLANFR